MKIPATTVGTLALLVASTSLANTIGYWRFESEPDPNAPFPDNFFGADFLEDSGPNDLDLTNPTASNPTFVNPAGDAGQSPNSLAPGFSNPVPQTGEANGRHAFTLNNDQFLFRPDEPIFDTGDFTIEAMVQFGVNVIDNGLNADIASQWGGGANNAWRLLKNSNNQLSLGLSGNGFAFFTSGASFTFDGVTDYYVAAVVDIEADETTNVTFYVKDLTAGTPLQVISASTGAANIPGPLNDSTSNFVIGGNAQTGDLAATRIDEVRLSSGLLAESDLLITPGATALPGDADGDGDVDGDDLIAVQTNFGATGSPPLLGDADTDGDVDGDDLISVQTNFGNVASVAVPEPIAIGLLAIGAPALLVLRRR